jgi:hypothetical protein
MRVQHSDVVIGAGAGVAVELLKAGTSTPAVLWADSEGTSQLPAVLTNDSGYYTVWLDEGEYDESVPASPREDRRISLVSYTTVAGIIAARTAGIAARAVASSNIAALSGEKAASETDGVVVPVGQVVLAIGQLNAVDNGPWVVRAGAWERPEGFSGAITNGSMVAVYDGLTFRGSIYVLTNTALTVTVGVDALTWQNNATGTTVAAEASPIIPAAFATYQKEQDWPFNALPLRADMFRWRADLSTLHPSSAAIVAAIKEGSNNKFAIAKETEYGKENFSAVLILGKSTDPVADYKDAFTYWPNVHKPAGAPSSNESTNKGVTIIDAPSGRAVTIGDSFISAHDLVKGPGYSANASEGAAVPIAGEALVADHVVSLEGKTTEGSANVTNLATVVGLYVGMVVSGTGIQAGSKVTVIDAGTATVTLDKTATASAASVALTFTGKSSTKETGGPSSARVEQHAALAIRFPNLYQADINWRNAIPHPMRATVPKKSVHEGAGMAPIATTKYAEGVVVAPADGRLPYVWPAKQGEVAENASTNVYAVPNGAWLRLDPTVYTEAAIAAMSCPNWVKAIYWALVRYGSFVIDVGGQEGLELCRPESLFSYKYRSDEYARNWLKSHTDGTWLVEEHESFPNESLKRWKFDLTGAGAQTAALYSALQVLKPPPIPTDLAV